MPESEFVLSRPPLAERSAEDQPFYLAQRKSDDPCTHVDLTAGSYSLSASQRSDHKVLNRKAAEATSSTISMADYVFNRPELLMKPGLPITI